jgi:hypothetical protein
MKRVHLQSNQYHHPNTQPKVLAQSSIVIFVTIAVPASEKTREREREKKEGVRGEPLGGDKIPVLSWTHPRSVLLDHHPLFSLAALGELLCPLL